MKTFSFKVSSEGISFKSYNDLKFYGNKDSVESDQGVTIFYSLKSNL